MKRSSWIVFLAAVALYLATVRYGFVQDDRAIVVSNPAAHSIGAAMRGFDDPYWPRESGAGMYRPVTILSYAIDRTLSGGRPGWFHVVNALWHGLVSVLVIAVLARWLPPLGALAAGLVFAWHPVHVEAVASVVGRAELLAAAGILGAVLAARRGWWAGAVLCAALAMFSKEHGVIAGVAILFDRWLQGPERSPTPVQFWIALGLVTAGFLAIWFAVGWGGGSEQAVVFQGRDAMGRLAVALPAVWRAALLLVWPASLSVEYGPRVIPAYESISLAALAGGCVSAAVLVLAIRGRRRAPAIAFGSALAALSYLPTSNVLFASGVVLAERTLYLAAVLPAALVAAAIGWLEVRRGRRPAVALLIVVLIAAGWRSFDRLPAWRDNRSHLLTLLAEHPESYRAHWSAAAVLAGTGDSAGARREYRVADSLFQGDANLAAARAIFLLGIGDSSGAIPLVRRARATPAGQRNGLRAQFLLMRARGDRLGALAVADSARRRFPSDSAWYRVYLQ